MLRRSLPAAVASVALTLALAACGDDEGPVTEPPPSVDISAPSDGGGEAPAASDGGEAPAASDGGGSADDAGVSDGGGGDFQAVPPDIPAPDPANYPGMDQNTPEGATQAFRYYMAVSMWARQTGDTQRVAELQLQDCESCREFNSDLDEIAVTGNYYSEFVIRDVGTVVYEPKTFDIEIGYGFVTSPHSRPNDAGEGRVDVGEVEYSMIGGLSWVDDAWRVGGLTGEWNEVGADAQS